MTRSNQDRIFANVPDNVSEVPTAAGPPPPAPPTAETVDPLHFIVPTEVVELPSKGKFYTNGHPLHGRSSLEMRHMTAKEEDILTTSSFLKKGIALDKMLQNVIVDSTVKVEDLLIGDKNALLIYARIFGYGGDYTTSLQCPQCSTSFEHTFDLADLPNKDFEAEMVRFEVEPTTNNTFIITLPRSEAVVEFRLLSTRDERRLMGSKKVLGSLDLLDAMIIGINDQTDRFHVKRFIKHLPIMDATVLKKVYAKIMPDVDLRQHVECSSCGEEAEMGVPLDAGFFWPDI